MKFRMNLNKEIEYRDAIWVKISSVYTQMLPE